MSGCLVQKHPQMPHASMGRSQHPAGPTQPKSAAFELTTIERADLDPLLLEPYVVTPSTTQRCEQDGTAATSVLRETWREVRRDLCAIRWGRGGLWFLFLFWIVGLLMCMIIMTMIWSGDSSSACLPDGTFSFSTQYDHWDISGFFQITSGFGQLTFSQAKAVDMVWDVAIGRIGQTILAVFSWRAFSLHIKTSLEEGPETRTVSYHTYWTIYLQDSISMMGVFGVIRDFLARRRLKSKMAMIFMVATMLFVLAWPTVASAMTGYDSNNVAFIKIRDGSLIRFNSFQPLLHIIHDGSRLPGLTDEYLVPCCSGTNGDDPTFEMQIASCSCNYKDEIYFLGENASAYTDNYGFFGLNNTNSTWPQGDINLPSPVLNISRSPVSRYSFGTEGTSRFWVDPRTGQRPFLDDKQMSYVYNNESYDYDYIITHGNGQCQPIGTYKWGFSYLQAFIALLLMTIWSVIVFVMWLKAHLKLSRRGPYEIPNRYKAAIKLTRSIALDFGDADMAYGLSNKEFTSHLRRHLKGGRVGADPAMALGKYSLSFRGFGGWVAREKWWFSAVVLCTLFCCVGWMLPLAAWSLLWLAVWAWPVLAFALAVGTTGRSRLFLSGCWLAIGVAWIVPLWEQR
ncbi:hypothetical protein KVR01_010449 [Diaporthe batatas]|uniref:uncharacterized protein n=1 Tax=Diaporthe batatas TaxID=748121 RepID=UPI001D0427D5|nr:uncharacterized protein KVR01_010449 [Diaporthe batatas]KAG8159812.1 hypothetical protein KVR01_010449 [Diaporthe batatas]